MAGIEDIEQAMNKRLFDRLGVDAEVEYPGHLPVGSRILIDRNATVTDDRGIVIESRCEIGLDVESVGAGTRGTIVDTGKSGDRWRLLDPIGDDGWESRWTATKA